MTVAEIVKATDEFNEEALANSGVSDVFDPMVYADLLGQYLEIHRLSLRDLSIFLNRSAYIFAHFGCEYLTGAALFYAITHRRYLQDIVALFAHVLKLTNNDVTRLMLWIKYALQRCPVNPPRDLLDAYDRIFTYIAQLKMPVEAQAESLFILPTMNAKLSTYVPDWMDRIGVKQQNYSEIILYLDNKYRMTSTYSSSMRAALQSIPHVDSVNAQAKRIVDHFALKRSVRRSNGRPESVSRARKSHFDAHWERR
jgi:hypothetical protein